MVAVVGRLLHPLNSVLVDSPRDTFREACASAKLQAALGHATAGDWLAVSPPRGRGLAAGAGPSQAPWSVRLVEAGRDAVVCAAGSAPPPKQAVAPVIYLPANIIARLGLTPGRSTVLVSRRERLGPDAAESTGPATAKRVLLSEVQKPGGTGRGSDAALRSFFRVPRVLQQGDIICIPSGGMPKQLVGIESGDHCVETIGFESGHGDGDLDALVPRCPDTRELPSYAGEPGDPLGGLAFQATLDFRVEVLDGEKASDPGGASQGCLRVDSSATEVVLQGVCQARGVPYIVNHLWCSAPVPLPLSLQGPCQQLSSLWVAALQGWLRPPAHGASAPQPVLIMGGRGCGKRILLRHAAGRLGLHVEEVNCYQLLAQSPGGLEEALQGVLELAARASPVVLCLRRLQALSATGSTQSPAAVSMAYRRLEAVLSGTLQELHAMPPSDAGKPSVKEWAPAVLLVGTCESPDDVPGPLRSVFRVEFQLPRPDEATRADALARLMPLCSVPEAGVGAEALTCEKIAGKSDESGPSMAKLTTGLSFSDLRSVCAEVSTGSAILSVGKGKCGDGKTPTQQDRIEQAVKRLQGGSKVAVTLASKVEWADVGGLQDAKDEVMNCITMPLAQGHLLGGQKLRSGVLLFGPPGTGKTLLAKAVATECRVHFLSVKGPELLSMYIGESEKNVRDLFRSARELQPCVLFFDELDSLAPARGRGSDSGGVMDRVVSQLVTELDSMPATVFLIGATNRPDLLDRSLLRPGRLDRMVYLGIAKDRLPLLKAITRKFDLDEFPTSGQQSEVIEGSLLQVVARACPSNLTGADVSVLCADAYGHAQREHIAVLDDIAARLDVPVGTLLSFFEAVEEAEVVLPFGDVDGREYVQMFPVVAELSDAGEAAAPRAGALSLWRCGSRGCVLLLAAHLDLVDSATPVPDGVAATAVLLRATASATPPDSIASASKAGPLVWPRACHYNIASDLEAELGRLRTAASNFDVCPLAGAALRIRVGWRHFQEALRQLQPSVPVEDLQRYEALAREHCNTGKPQR